MNVLSNCISVKSKKSGLSDDKISIPRIYCAYEDSKQLLELLRDAFKMDSKLPGKINKILIQDRIKSRTEEDDKSRCLEQVLLNEITSMCVHYNDRTAVEELAKKYVTEVNEWQPIVEKGLSLTACGEDSKTKIR